MLKKKILKDVTVAFMQLYFRGYNTLISNRKIFKQTKTYNKKKRNIQN